jgi:hypothetical protein
MKNYPAAQPWREALKGAIPPALNGAVIGLICGVVAVTGRGSLNRFCLAALQEAWIPKTVLLFLVVEHFAAGFWFMLLAGRPELHRSPRLVPRLLRTQIGFLTASSFQVSATFACVLAGAYLSTVLLHSIAPVKPVHGDFIELALSFAAFAAVSFSRYAVEAGFKLKTQSDRHYYCLYGLAAVGIALALLAIGCWFDWGNVFVIKAQPTA